MDSYIFYNGKLVLSAQPMMSADNRGFRFGHGLFETMRLHDGLIPLADLHFERLFYGMQSIGFELSSINNKEKLMEEMVNLVKLNKHTDKARIRLIVYAPEFRANDEAYIQPEYIIQSSPLPKNYGILNKEGLRIGIFPGGRKAIDDLSAIKTNNRLVYTMATRFAESQGWDDCLLLNSKERVAESTISNIFWIKNKIVYTPPLSEGCVAGVMRRWLLKQLPALGFECIEKEWESGVITDADELFLTNALSGIRWVASLDTASYSNSITQAIYNDTIRVLWK